MEDRLSALSVCMSLAPVIEGPPRVSKYRVATEESVTDFLQAPPRGQGVSILNPTPQAYPGRRPNPCGGRDHSRGSLLGEHFLGHEAKENVPEAPRRFSE